MLRRRVREAADHPGLRRRRLERSSRSVGQSSGDDDGTPARLAGRDGGTMRFDSRR